MKKMKGKNPRVHDLYLLCFYRDMSFNLIAKLPQKVFKGLRSARTL